MTDPTTVFVAVIEERHSDTEPYVFSTAEAAIAYARFTRPAEASVGSEGE